MRKLLILITFSILGLGTVRAAHPDSVYIFSYGNPQNSKDGLHLSWSIDNEKWNEIGHNYSVVKSDFGSWGSQKNMFTPSVLKDGDMWYAVWSLGKDINQFATTNTKNLTLWKPQDYPFVKKGLTVLNPVLSKKNDSFVVSFKSTDNKFYQVSSKDFINWSEAVEIESNKYNAARKSVTIRNIERTGDVSRISWDMLNNILNQVAVTEQNNAKYRESMRDDSKRFANLNNVSASLTLNYDNSKSISPDLIGIFFEDISYAADGGLYAELIQNRDFEYTALDNNAWNSQSFWRLEGEGSNWEINTDSPIHANNSHYSVLTTNSQGASLVNVGFDGISLKKGEKYNLSLFLKALDGKSHKVCVQLLDSTNVVAETILSTATDWKNLKKTLTAKCDTKSGKLAIKPLDEGKIAIDFVSLFPQNTFKNRPNGLRKDLAQLLSDMHPRFVRFPGGCVSHGQGLHNMYRWVNTVGPLWERKPLSNIWSYHQTAGLGFYEYFQFCEDIGAEPLPVLPAGVSCQNSWRDGHGQQGGLAFEGEKQALGFDDLPTMEEYLQELLNLIEWANGDPKTSKWAKMRADAGHPKPFNLKYLGIGNEDLISEVFVKRFNYLNRAIKAKYPEIQVVGTVGPFFDGSDYEYGWELARKENVDIVDEHYYVSPGWYIHNQDFYDKYDRKGTKVYLGEWASQNRFMENALAEALHLINLERNADVVVMSSYAPLFCNEKHAKWNPDMIYFNNDGYTLTPSYYVQMLYGQNNGKKYIPGNLKIQGNEDVNLRVRSSVVEAENGDLIIKLVNLLPATVDMTIDLGDLSAFSKTAKLSVLSGEPFDKEVQPVYSSIEVKNNMAYSLPKYSLSVIRIKKNK